MSGKLLPICCLMVLLCGPAKAADDANTFRLKIGAVAERTSLPTFKSMGSRLGGGAAVGTEFYYKDKPGLTLLQTADVSFFAHRQWGTTFLPYSQFGVRPKIRNFWMDFKIGPGYQLFYHYTPTYKWKDGNYEKASRVQGKFSGLASLGMSYSTPLVRPYLNYSLMIESPFIRSQSAFLPHQMLELGVFLNLQKRKK